MQQKAANQLAKQSLLHCRMNSKMISLALWYLKQAYKYHWLAWRTQSGVGLFSKTNRTSRGSKQWATCSQDESPLTASAVPSSGQHPAAAAPAPAPALQRTMASLASAPPRPYTETAALIPAQKHHVWVHWYRERNYCLGILWKIHITQKQVTTVYSVSKQTQQLDDSLCLR